MGTSLKPVHILGGIYHIQFPDSTTMASTMLRFQEHYESPKFRGLTFSRKEFEAWYTERTGAWTYLEDWSGFNIPSTTIDSFLRRNFYPASDQELELLESVVHLTRPFYLIATAESASLSTLRHEIAHGLYATNPDYRAEVYMLLEGCQLAPIHRFLWGGYHPAVWLDECHAYLSANYRYLRNEGVLKDDSLKEIHEALSGTFEYYTNGKFKEK